MWYLTSVLWICSLGCLQVSVLALLSSEANGRPRPRRRQTHSSAPRLPVPGVKWLMFVPATLLLVSAGAVGSNADDISHPHWPPHSCVFPKWEKFLSIHRIRKWYSLLSICFCLFISWARWTCNGLFFFLGGWLRESAWLSLLVILEGREYAMVCITFKWLLGLCFTLVFHSPFTHSLNTVFW